MSLAVIAKNKSVAMFESVPFVMVSTGMILKGVCAPFTSIPAKVSLGMVVLFRFGNSLGRIRWQLSIVLC